MANQLTVKQRGPTEIFTNEHGGPVRTWNHRLTFGAIDDDSCRYTDEIETDDGWHGAPTRLFIRLMFRYRRWRTLAQTLSGTAGPCRPPAGARPPGTVRQDGTSLA